MKQRRIGFFNLFSEKGDSIFEVKDNLITILCFIEKQTNKSKKKDISDDRICFLDSYSYNDNDGIVKILFKSAKHSYRAPLLNRNTVESRENPKTKEEGEQVKTHLLIKFIEGDAIVFLETGRSQLSMKVITEYLNTFLSLYNNKHKNRIIDGHFNFNIIPRDDFKEVLDGMQRVTCASVYIDKQILGSNALNFSNRIEHVQKDIVVEIKTERNRSIKETVCDIVSSLSRSQIKRIRVKGNMPGTGECIIDTDYIVKKEYIDAQQSEETGEFNTQFMFSQLELLASGF